MRRFTGSAEVVGLRWWGTDVRRIAESISDLYNSVQSVEIWDLARRLDRRLMASPLEGLVADFRLVRGSSSISDLSLVTAAHRMSEVSTRRCRAKAAVMVALIGDRLSGARAVSERVLQYYDYIVIPDETWADGLPSYLRSKVVIRAWGSTIIDPVLSSAVPYRPKGLLMVGAPYSERRQVLQLLVEAGARVTVQGPGWLPQNGVEVRPQQDIDSTIRAAHQGQQAIVNVQHKQFVLGRNPQSSDYAYSGTPQLLIYPHDLQRAQIGLSGGHMPLTSISSIKPEILQKQARVDASIARDTGSMSAMIRDVIE